VGAGWARQGLLETGLAADGLRMACTGVTGRLLVPLEFEGLFMVRLELKSCDMGALVRARAETRVDGKERVGSSQPPRPALPSGGQVSWR
jgi:hypothetical protein